jgi:fatty-acyl-CoA synthase
MSSYDLPSLTIELYERTFAARHRLPDVVDWWAERKPGAPALIHHTRDETVTWADFAAATRRLASRLAARGFRKGDRFATFLPFSAEHILLEYACFRLGVLHVPLDLRLPSAEIVRCLGLVQPRGFAHPGTLPEGLAEACPFLEHIVSLPPGAGLRVFDDWPSAAESEAASLFRQVAEDDGAQVIFTTGSTGSPKPALLTHRNITAQNVCLGAAFEFQEDSRVLINLPPSHVGGQAELLMSALFWGGTAVLLDVFDPAKSLAAIEQRQVTLLGQIPAMFQFEWRLPDYAQRDLSSLRTVVYGGQQVSREFLEKMAAMAPRMATGLGLTESAGFCTYTPLVSDPAALEGTLGGAAPLYPLTIREPMRADGSAGAELPAGQVGHICFRGPQTFAGYLGDARATANTISTDGHLYTGDLGSLDSRGVRLAGRAKWVIKPAGYQVFPGDVEAHFLTHPKIAACSVVGAEHRTLSEAIVAFVEPKPGTELTVAELRRHARPLASYMRPLHYVLVTAGQLPLNRTAKVDTVRLQQLARDEIQALRARGRWDT